MTEILGHDDAYDGERSQPARPGRPAGSFEPPLVELLGDEAPADGDPEDLESADQRSGIRAVLTALTEPASLAVASALSILASVAVGPSYRFAAYPFNQGITSVKSVFGTAGVGIHPLRSYLSSVAPAAALTVLAILAGLLSLRRGRPGQPAWVRALGAGALVVGVVLAALVVLGAWQSSGFDLDLPPNTLSST